MAKTAIALRLTPEDLVRVDAYAKARKSSRQVVLETFVLSGLDDTARGVPDLVAPEPRPAVKPVPTVVRASSLEAKRRANPAGMDRQANIERQRGA